ncbi:12607_t:CDS:2 [Racocetra fulgida]|uniref:12607_t:CDS:1 n=1 Tax=Racocetra fulgida TaxID=60492 RepID=A0A9N9FUR3_9GLOM|nr:12607_t:CDS:2 [Racocetra fulgida]
MSDDNMVLELEDTDSYEPENINSYEPENVDLGDSVYSDLDEPGCSDLDKPGGIDLDGSESNDMDSNDNNEDTFQSSTLSQTDGSTSNLWRHLRNKHHILRAMVEGGRVKVVVKSNNSCDFFVIPESSQSTIVQSFNKVKKYALNNPKQKNLDNNVAAFIVEELQPFSITQSQAFKRIIEELDTQANVLSNDHLKEILINSEDKILQNLREYAHDSAEISYVSFTTDMWISNNGDPYIGLTLHWINNCFQVKEITGNISYLPYPHTSECLLSKIVEILDNLQLKCITVSGTVDNGANIKLCLEKLERKHSIFIIHYFGYTLQLAINDVLKDCSEITNLIKRCKDVVSHFSGSPKQKQFLLEAQMEIEDWNNFLFVVRDVSMWWNSTFYLLKRLTILKPAMYRYKSILVENNDNSSLRSYEEKELSSDEWEKVNELVKLLYPYEVISKKLSGSQYPTLSQAWFAINFIKVKLDCAIVSNADIRRFGGRLRESLQERFLEPTKLI